MPDNIDGSKLRKDIDSLNATSRSRVLGNIIKQIRVLLSGPAHGVHWANNVEGFGND